MKILITGGAGFIGSNLVSFHLEKGDEVYIIDNFITGSKKNIEPFLSNTKFHCIKSNLINFKFKILNFKFDIVYHLASPASPCQYKKHPLETALVNSQGTYNVLEFMKNSKSKIFVLASTSEVYGDPQIHPQTESYWGNVSPNGPRSCYDEGKRFAEALTMIYYRKYNLDVRIARIFNTYGPDMEKEDGRVVSNFIMQSLTNNPLTVYGDGKQTRSFCFVSDMVTGLYTLATTPNIAGEIINLGNPEEYSILDLAKIIKKATKTDAEIIFKSIDADDPQRRMPDISKAKKILKWQPKISFNDGLQKTINYFKQRFLA